MATLTEIGFYSRQAIKLGGVAILVIMIVPFIFRGARSIYLNLNPPPPPVPTTRYGKLPKLIFPAEGQSLQITYKLETIEGGLPTLPDTGKVYVVGINKSRLLELERAKAKARVLGFVNEPAKLDDYTFRFGHPAKPATLTVNLVSGGFSYKVDYLSDKTNFVPVNLISVDQAGAEAKIFLQSLGALPTDLADGVAKSQYLIATFSGEMRLSPSYSEANFVRTDIYRSDKDEMKVVTAGGEVSPVNLLFSGVADGSKKIVDANYHYSNVVGNDFATYPLKKVDLAWSELTQGKGFATKNLPNAVIRKVSLAYYESNEPQQFLQPVYVFEGDGKFAGYVQAVDASFIQE